MTVSARISVPATTSNLGGGFDCVGIAIGRRLTLDAEMPPGDGEPVTIVRDGTLRELTTRPDDDLIVAGFVRACARAGAAVPRRLAFRVTSEIPVGRGLGSSAAALIAGAAAANALLALGLDDAALVAVGSELEGHPDNVAPAVLGGAVLAVHGPSHALVTAPIRVDPGLRFVFATPDFAVDTHRARASLPAEISHETARAAAAAAAALIAGLERGDPALLAAGLEGPLHIPYRRPLVTGYDAVTAAARAGGAIGATLSGSGSSIVAIAPAPRADAVAAAMGRAWSALGTRTLTFVSVPSTRGHEVHSITPLDAGRNTEPRPAHSH